MEAPQNIEGLATTHNTEHPPLCFQWIIEGAGVGIAVVAIPTTY